MQLEIDGVGQQKATLADWKKENRIYTHHSPHMDKDNSWCCWDEYANPEDFAGKYSYEAMSTGGSEKAVITEFCNDNSIELPFWW